MRAIRRKLKRKPFFPNMRPTTFTTPPDLDGMPLRPGEIVRIHDRTGMLTGGIFRFYSADDGLLVLELGDSLLGVRKEFVDIVERNLPEPLSWLPREIEQIRQTAKTCNCKLCHKLLVEKEAELARLGVEVPALAH